MLFSVGIVEVLFVIVLALSALVLFLRRSRHSIWLTAAAICCALAVVMTPADPVSTILFGVVFFGCFFAGTKYRSLRSPIIS